MNRKQNFKIGLRIRHQLATFFTKFIQIGQAVEAGQRKKRNGLQNNPFLSNFVQAQLNPKTGCYVKTFNGMWPKSHLEMKWLPIRSARHDVRDTLQP